MTRALLPALLITLLAACGSEARAPDAEKPFRALVFTKTTGFRHDSIPAGVAAIERLGRRHRFSVDTTANAGRFTPRQLARYDVVVFLSTTGTPLARGSQRRAFEGFIRAGGGYVGVHAASDTRGGWPWYERLVGARFKRHDPGTPPATVRVEDRGTAATRGLPEAWQRVDEWYEFRSNPRGRAHVLATRRTRRRPSDRVVPPLRWRPLGVHRDGSYDGVLRRAALRRPPARSDRDGRRTR